VAVRRTKGAWFVVLFALPFLVGGVAVLVYAGTRWWLYLAARSWKSVPATIQRVELEDSSDGDGLTYAVTADYTYQVGGRAHTGHRVGIMGGTDSNYSKHSARYLELRRHRDTGQPFLAFVNPDDPSDAVLYRDADEWMYVLVPFGLVFTGVGLSLLGYVASGLRDVRRLREIDDGDAGRHWHVRSDWQRGCVVASTVKDSLLRCLLGAGLAAFVSVFVIFLVCDGASWYVWAFIGPFVLIALAAVLNGALSAARQVVHGTPVLHLSEVPIVPGRRVSAVVRTARPLRPRSWNARLQFHMPCGEGSSSQEKARQEVEARLDRLPGGRKHLMRNSVRGYCAYALEVPPAGEVATDSTGAPLLPLVIEVPAGAPPSDLDPNTSVSWALLIKVKARPLSLAAAFILPVFYAEEHEIETRPLGA
jgi:hypothetical protein